jgi:hypothetical protein
VLFGVGLRLVHGVETAGFDLFEKCPKSVFAAIAVSALTCGGDYLDEARERVTAEWWALYDNKIVAQKPPFPRPTKS